MYYPSPWSCAVCRNPADVWYKQNGSALCSACDIRLQNSNHLESAHVRTALPSCVVVQTTATADQGRSPWDYANSGEGNTDEFRNWSNPCANPVPDVYNEFGAKQSAMVTMPSFESLELFQAGLDDQTFQYGNGDCLNKAACRTVETVEADGAAVPTCPSATYDPMPADGAGNTLARFAPSQSVNQGLAATTHTSVAAESVPAARDQPSATVDHNVAGQATQPAFAPAMQLPAFCCAPAALQATPTATYPQMGSQSVPSWAPMQQAMPFVAAMPAMMPMGWHMPLWMTYIPASLQPHHNSSKKEAAERAQIRKRQISRFQGKKQLLSCRKTVRYASRKLYADSRPRVHGRFIRKADVAAPTA